MKFYGQTESVSKFLYSKSVLLDVSFSLVSSCSGLLSFLNEFASLLGVGWISKLRIWIFMYFMIVYKGHGKFPTSGWA